MAEKTKVVVNFEYDQEAQAYLGNTQSVFKKEVRRKIEQFFTTHKELVTAEHMNIICEIIFTNKRGFAGCEHIKKESFTLWINLKKFSEEGNDIKDYIRRNIPATQWFVLTKWYGKRTTLTDLIEHEIRHFVDKEYKHLGKAIKAMVNAGHTGITIELMRGVEQIRSEVYPKLFDSQGKISFSHDRLFQIKLALLSYVKSYGKHLPSSFSERKGWFLGLIHVNDHHYYLATYMGFIIAYSLMDPHTKLNSKGTKVKDLNTAINRGWEIQQPSRHIKHEAGEIIRKSNPVQFLRAFEKACQQVNIKNNNIPLNYTIYRNFLKELIEKQKLLRSKHLKTLVQEWKKGNITFKQLEEKALSTSQKDH